MRVRVQVTRVSWYTIDARDEAHAWDRFCDGVLETVKPDEEQTTDFQASEVTE